MSDLTTITKELVEFRAALKDHEARVGGMLERALASIEGAVARQGESPPVRADDERKGSARVSHDSYPGSVDERKGPVDERKGTPLSSHLQGRQLPELPTAWGGQPDPAAERLFHPVMSTQLSSHLHGRLSDSNSKEQSFGDAAAVKKVPVLGPCLAVLGKLGTSEAPQRSDPLSKFADSRLFSTLVYGAILLNCVFMIISADEAIHVAINDPDREPSDFIKYCGYFFLIVYSVELVVKLWRYRLHFFCDGSWKYNLLDLFLVILGLYSTIFEGLLPNYSWMRLLRLLKLAKALRVFRLIAMIKPLRAILQSLVGTVDTLFWSILMLVVILFLFALILVIRVASFIQEDPSHGEVVLGENGETVIGSLEATYGSVGLTVLHLFMCSTGGNDWAAYYDPLVPTGAINCFLFLLFIAFTQIAVLNIILGIFVDDAMKKMVAGMDERAQEHAEEQLQTANDLKDLLYELDTSGDNKLSPDEWRRAVKIPKVKNYLNMMDFRANEVRDLLEHMCAWENGDAIPIEAFVSACMRFKGAASCFDMQTLLHAIGDLKAVHQGAK